MTNSRGVKWTDPGIWICGWRSWFTSNSQCGARQPTKHVWVSVSLSGKGWGWNGKSRVIQSSIFHRRVIFRRTQRLHQCQVCASSIVPACFQPCLLTRLQMNGEAIYLVSRDSSCLSGAAGLVVFECGPRLGLATLASSYFLGTWKSFLCCVHTCPRVLTELFDPTLVSISQCTMEVVDVF